MGWRLHEARAGESRGGVRGVIRGDGPKTTYHIDGKEVTKAEFDAAFPDRPVGEPSLVGWVPIISDALAVHPRQVKEAIADARAKGVPTEFLPDGRPVLSSRSHRKRYLKAYGFHDRSGGYGD
jgi:hypothetical protein